MQYVILITLFSIFSPVQPEGPTANGFPHRYADDEVHLIAPGLVSTKMGEYSPTFDPARNELYFMRRTPGVFD
ncbi:hypothetical protein [Lewinella sp. W8]|uniref:hypothetical protein n=1 Tax=Lewinella sp. W8 TaxID=2528208 RepID=UPI001067C93B|nr:hypothetical protein [Lewinella sp. W8]MTB51775.1 hypothetical protein [Lewinella sp. W8]